MKKLITIVLALLATLSCLMAQDYSDTIRITYGNNYYLATHKLGRSEIKTLMKQYDESWDYMKKARKNLHAERFLEGVGVTMCFLSLGFTSAGPAFACLGSGIVIALTGYLVFGTYYKMNKLNAIKCYNSKRKEGQEFKSYSLSAGLTDNGVGIIFRF
jgi:hypothetical protein